MLFIHFQGVINKAVTGSANTEPSNMTAQQLYQVALLEQKIDKEIENLRLEGIVQEMIRNDVLAMIKPTNEEAPNSDQTERGLQNVQR
jgi:hypothetical protein